MEKGELQLGCDDDRQAKGLAPMHYAMVKDELRLRVEGPEKFGRSHERSTWCTIKERVQGGGRGGDEDGVGHWSSQRLWRLPVRWERERLKGVKGWRRPDTPILEVAGLLV